MSPTTEEMGRHPPALHALLRLHISAGMLVGASFMLAIVALGESWRLAVVVILIKIALDVWRTFRAEPRVDEREGERRKAERRSSDIDHDWWIEGPPCERRTDRRHHTGDRRGDA